MFLRVDAGVAGRFAVVVLRDLARFAAARGADFVAADCALVAAGFVLVAVTCGLDRVTARVLVPPARLEDAARDPAARAGPCVAFDLVLLVPLRVLLLPDPRELLLRVDDPRRDFPPLVAIYDSPRNRSVAPLLARIGHIRAAIGYRIFGAAGAPTTA